MTEQEWLKCTDPVPILEFLSGKASDRKMRLFACACCRNVGNLLLDKRSWLALEIIERVVDETVTLADRNSADKMARRAAVWARKCGIQYEQAAEMVLTLVRTTAYPFIPSVKAISFAFDVNQLRTVKSLNPQAANFGTECLRDIFGNPFRLITINSAWLAWNDGTVRKIAQSIYDECAFDRLPILADALTDAGCDDADILNHCRSEGPHVKGCWVVDLLLGKE